MNTLFHPLLPFLVGTIDRIDRVEGAVLTGFLGALLPRALSRVDATPAVLLIGPLARLDVRPPVAQAGVFGSFELKVGPEKPKGGGQPEQNGLIPSHATASRVGDLPRALYLVWSSGELAKRS